ncbi:MAG: hypothetical protein GY820_08555 [Gammaproteobacteria bacterium]|nr:hypothetical protein [Gammaproteobacteria bacterium]
MLGMPGKGAFFNKSITECFRRGEGRNICFIQGSITWQDVGIPPFDLVIIHKERHPFKASNGKETWTRKKDDCGLHLRFE